MTVRELVESNAMITDLAITVRNDKGWLMDQLNIGCYEGKKPRFPVQVPIKEEYIGNQSASTKRDAHYIDKSINSWDDGKDYWQIKTNRIPDKWLDLNVTSWEAYPASILGNARRSTGHARNTNFHGQKVHVTVLPSGQNLEIKVPQPKEPEDDGQITLDEWCENVMEI